MKELIDKLKHEGVLKTQEIIEAFLACDRKDFLPEELKSQAYLDAPLSIGEGQTISQPYTVAFMLELLQPKRGQKVLDVGFGSGWTTALLAGIVGREGKVFGLEIVPELFEFGKNNIEKFGYQNIKLDQHSGWDGWEEHAPFDRILVSAAAPEEPEKLKDQLKVKGRMVIPVGGEAVDDLETWASQPFYAQALRLIKKNSENKFEKDDHPGFAFVPLIK